VGIVQAHLDLGAAGGIQGDDTVGRRPVRRTLVDQREHEHPLDLRGVGQVDVQVLALGAGAGPVVGVEPDDPRVGCLAQFGAERVAQCLHDALGAVGELVQAAQVQVELLGAAEQSTSALRQRVPVQVHPHLAGGRTLLGQGHGRCGLGQAHLARPGWRRRFRLTRTLRVVDAHAVTTPI
jgi:hypothetical protein